MGIADARAMHPQLEIAEAEPDAEARLLAGIADWCDRYTPLVALCGDDGLFLDITGCAHLFGGEKALLDDIVARLAAQGFRAFSALASTPGMAWAAARFLHRAVVAPGAEAAALAPLPLAALRLQHVTRVKLESVGLRDAGAIMAAPRAPLARRFGRSLLLRLDQALGAVEEAVSPRLPMATLGVERHLIEPVTEREDIERLVLLLAQTLKTSLERRGEGARSLELVLFRVDGAVRRLGIGMARPLRDPALIQRLFREKLAVSNIDPDCGFEMVRLTVPDTVPFAMEQTDLTENRAGNRQAAAADLAMFADRVRARLGDNAVLLPKPFASHLPERAIILQPFHAAAAPAGQGAETGQHGLERPIRLLARPEPVDVAAAELPEGPPASFRWRRVLYRVARAEGPERIAAEWWCDGDEAPTRDYFRIEDEDGRRYWLFRQGLYGAGATPRWFLHGLFA